MKSCYLAIFTNEGVGFSTVVPDLKGCFSEGTDFDSAVKNTQKAIELYLDGMKKYPKPSDTLDIEIGLDGRFIVPIIVTLKRR